MQKSIQNEYLDMLRPWAEAMKPYLFTPDDRPDLMYFGDGTKGWGEQTNAKAFAAYAVLAAMPGGEPKWLDTALALLRYSLESHVEGSYHVTDGDDVRWGRTWISALAIERMMHGVDAIWEHLTDEDHALLRKVILSEADQALNGRELVAGLYKENKNNVPESNMWTAAIMLRAASMYPDAPDAAAYIRRGTEFLINSISVPSSAEDMREYEGRTVAEQFVGANFFEDMACNHHGYMNVGYMVITMSNAAILHFYYRSRGLKPPKVLYHNWDRLWQMVKSCLFDDGRLLRIGGDSRVRYCYCQDYLLQVLNMAADCLGEDVEGLERGWIGILKKEMKENGDGTFLSNRTEFLIEKSPLYYTRLEADRACCISFSAWYRHQFNNFAEPAGTGDYEWNPKYTVPLTQWSNDYHGSYFVRDPGRYAAFTWRSSQKPMALCVPPSDSSLVEWKQNLVGDVRGDGTHNGNGLEDFGGKMLDGGFVTWGSYIAHTTGLLAEQIDDEYILRNQIACTALPDGVTMLTIQLGTALKTCHVSSVTGLNLNIPNDMFNDYRRNYVQRENRITIDNKMTVVSVYGGELSILRPPYRQIGLKKGSWIYYDRGFLHTDVIAMPAIERPAWFTAGSIVFDIGAAVLCEGGFVTGRHMEKLEFSDYPLVRAVRVEGADGKRYTFIANFAAEDVTLTADGISTITLAAGEAELIG